MTASKVKTNIYLERIEKVTKELLTERIEFNSLTSAIDEYKSVLLEASELKLNSDLTEDLDDIQFENGIAIGTTWAALCVQELIRTRQFIRGIVKAVKDVESEGKMPIRILYAGSGPFATLVLPLVTLYSSEELQITVMETNSKSIQYLKSVISKLGIENYFKSILNVDATTYKLEEPEKIDILLSETMQHALLREQQVPIMLNLVDQLKRDIRIIPELIKLDLAYMNSSIKLLFEDRMDEKYKVLTSLWNFESDFINRHNNLQRGSENKNEIELLDKFDLGSEIQDSYDKLVVSTSIQVYKDEWIYVDQCSLTIPYELLDLQRMEESKKVISLKYVISGNPRFEQTLHSEST